MSLKKIDNPEQFRAKIVVKIDEILKNPKKADIVVNILGVKLYFLKIDETLSISLYIKLSIGFSKFSGIFLNIFPILV